MGVLTTTIVKQVVAALSPEYEGPYVWQGVKYQSFIRVETPTGYMDEYTGAMYDDDSYGNNQFCHR